MKTFKRLYFIITITIFSSTLLSQSSITDVEGFLPYWQQAGLQNNIPIEDYVLNVSDSQYDLDNTGATDVGEELNLLIESANNLVNSDDDINYCAVYLRAGTYYVKSQIDMKSGVILRGAGSDATEIKVLIGDYNNQTSDDWEPNGIKFNNVSNAGVEDLRIERYDQFL